MRKISWIISLMVVSLSLTGQTKEKFVDNLLQKMTLEEKIGQLNQYSGDGFATGKVTVDPSKLSQIERGEVGAMLNVFGVENVRKLQQAAMKSRLKIPLIFGQDVIHGFRTTFPIPLGEAASWDLNLMEKTAHTAATEASAYGINWTFAPMVDICRDPRWGRIMEGAGEDPFLGSKIAVARVKGFQGKGLGQTDAVMACAKHFAGYGAAIGGRDYNTVDMSRLQLNEVYLPPFKAAANAGVATFMNAFNALNGIPSTANTYLLRDLLKGEWKYSGFVVSDWASIKELITQGVASNRKEAAFEAITAGCDMDMESRCYRENLKSLVLDGKVPVSIVDDAVRRILIKKYELGLFSDPFRFCQPERELQQTNNTQNRQLAREAGEKSIVLLRNENQLLPLNKTLKSLALIGPLVKSTIDNYGSWSVHFPDDSSRVVSLYEGIKTKLNPETKLYYSKGCNINDSDESRFEAAVQTAKMADVVVMSLGESWNMSGESKSKSNLHLPGVQENLLKAIYATGKPVVLLINAGRPLIFNWASDHVPAILYTWWLGSEAGNAIADVLFGDYNPSAKLPVTFPRAEGQIPMYYDHFNTGRPPKDDNDMIYTSRYIDLPITPAYVFGYGLSYTHFSFSNLKLSTSRLSIKSSEPLVVDVDVTNDGGYDGEEVVQLYVRDWVGSVVRPVKELKGFEKISIKKGETKTIHFKLNANNLKFFNAKIKWVNEPGKYTLFMGDSSNTVLETNFELTE